MSHPESDLKPSDALIVVDMQNDFCPGGALPIKDAHRVVPVLNRWIAAALAQNIPVYASRDWHPAGHLSFKERGGSWPVHCLQDSPGAAFHPGLKLDPEVVRVTKGVRFDQDQYSVFDQTGLARRLRDDGVKRLWIGGLAQDVCVLASVLDAREEGFEVNVIEDATLPVTAQGRVDARRRMEAAGAGFVATD